MQVTVTNLSSVNPVYISSFYTSIAPSASITVVRTMAQVDADVPLKTAIVNGSVSVAYTEQAGDDIAGGGTLEAGIARCEVIHKAFAAGAGGSADDVVIYASNAPYAFDIIHVVAKIVTVVSASTIQLRDTAAGAGTTLSDALTSATTGVRQNTAATTSPSVLRNGTLILRRSDSGVAGSIDILVLRVS